LDGHEKKMTSNAESKLRAELAAELGFYVASADPESITRHRRQSAEADRCIAQMPDLWGTRNRRPSGPLHTAGKLHSFAPDNRSSRRRPAT
jgi:hypothetical protein